MQKKYEIVYSKKFVQKFKNVLINYYKYDTYMEFLIIPFLWQKTLMYIPLLSYSDRKYNEIDDLLELTKDTDYQIRTLNFSYDNFKKDDMVTMRLNIEDINEDYYHSFSSATKRNIKKSQTFNFTKKIGNSDKLLEHFYQIYSKTMYRLGTPALQKGFFYTLKEEFKDNIKFYNFYDGYKIIASSCSILDNEIGIVEWLGIDEKYKHTNIGYLMYLSIIEDYKHQNLKILDFGRSAYGGGTHRFKSNFKMYPIKIDVFKPYEEDIYEKYKLASEIWKKLPYNVVTKLNWISKYLKDL